MSQFEDFKRDGSLFCRQLVPRNLVDAMLQEARAREEWSPEYQGWSEYYSESDSAKALVVEKLRNLVTTGFGKEIAYMPKAQIARVVRCPAREFYFHVDGAADPKQEWIDPYGLMVGVFLTDLIEQDRGNFTVWPGSHREIQQAFNGKYGRELVNAVRNPGPTKVPSRQITASAGDVIITHHLLAHGTAKNVADTTRYVAFFRFEPIEWANRFGEDKQARDKSYVEEPWQFSDGWKRHDSHTKDG